MTSTSPPPRGPADLRVSDRDRDAVAEQLREHAGEGRLEPAELSDRLEAAYSARTRAELDALIRDLPAVAPQRKATVERRRELRGHVVAFVAVNLLLIGIWAASGAGYFWPIWPLLGWGLGLVLHRGEGGLGPGLSPCGHRRRHHPGPVVW